MRRPAILVTSLGATLGLLLAGCAAGPAPAPDPAPAETAQLESTVVVLAAASLTDVFEEIASAFEAENPGTKVVLSFGGSSALAEQIIQGSPADVFAAANEQTMQLVVDGDLATEPILFATNVLELVVPAGNPGAVTSLADLARPELAIAICAVEVPCGAASVTLLEAAGVTAAPDSLEQDVRAVLTRVRLGEADAGLVYRTDVIAAGDDVEGVELPEADAAANLYPIATIGGAANTVAADAFLTFVLGEQGQRILREAGFGAP